MKTLTQDNYFKARDLESARAMLGSLPRVMWYIRFHMRRNRMTGLSVPQFRTLAQLASLGEQSVSEIAENLGCSLPTASRMIDKLVDLGLIHRKQRTDNRRKVALTLTEKGRRVFEDSSRQTEEAMARVVAGLTDEEHAQLLNISGKLRELFDPHVLPTRIDGADGDDGDDGSQEA